MKPITEVSESVMELSSIVTSSTTASPASHHPPNRSASSAPDLSSLHHTDTIVENHLATSASRMSDMEFAPHHSAHPAHTGRPASMSQLGPKTVRFQLISAESPQYQARLPMRVQIYPHDTTDSIVTTVKNFYGLYSSPTVSKGVSFEDEENNTMIARYENFRQGMTVYVRVIEAPAAPGAFPAPMFSPPPVGAQAYMTGASGGGASGSDSGWASLQPPQNLGQHISRPGSRTSRMRSPSPNSGRGRRSTSASTHPKARSRSNKNRGPGSQGGQAADACSDSLNGYSSGDNAPGSASGKGKEHIGNTEISVENIVEGGRRKRAKFESSVSRLPVHCTNRPVRRPRAFFCFTCLFSSRSRFLSNLVPFPTCYRSSRYSHLRRCRLPLRTRPSRRPVAPIMLEPHCPSSTRDRPPSPTSARCNRLRHIPTASLRTGYTLRPCRRADTPGPALGIRPRTASAREPAYYPRPTLPSAAACRRRTKTLRCS